MGRTIKSHYYYGNKISEYGIQNGYVDYATLVKAFDAVLCNDITTLFYSTINNEYVEPEQVNGVVDNSEEIDELREEIEQLENSISEAGNLREDETLYDKIAELEEQIEELEDEQEAPPEIYQYYIISSSGADILQYDTNEIVYYIESLDMYIWGVTHWGTSWDYVLTDIKIEEE